MSPGNTVERIDLETEGIVYHEHIARYDFARTHLRPGWTLDLACGVGYGTHLLAQHPGVSAVGVDLDHPSLRKARVSHPSPRISFLAASGTSLPFRDGCFQNVVSLETIEHIADDHAFLSQITRVLHPDGVCILSTPNSAYTARHQIDNPYHVREYSEDELRRLLLKFFSVVDVSYQGFTDRYHDRVRSYARSIKAQSASLSPTVRLMVNHLYRPLKRLVPSAVTNLGIRRLLRLAYPQPGPSELIIATEPVQDASVLITVCQQPHPIKQ